MKKTLSLLALSLSLSAHVQAATPQVLGSTLSAGVGHVCGIKEEDSTIVCWGYNEYGQTQAPQDAFLQVDSGYYSNCGLTTNHQIKCWGHDSVLAYPVDTIPAGGKFIQTVVGGYHACALQDDGGVRCWGDNTDGRATPLPGPFIQLALGDEHSCGLRSDGSVECWGKNDYGQNDPPGELFKSITAGFKTTCGITTTGNGVCWGYADVNYGLWQQISFSLHGSTSSSRSYYLACGLREDYSLHCPRTQNYKVTPPSGRFSYVVAGGWAESDGYDFFACGIRENKLVACWGNGRHGRTNAPEGITIKPPFELISRYIPLGVSRINNDLSVNVPYAVYQTPGPLPTTQELWFNLRPGCTEGGLNWTLQDYGEVK